MKRAHILPLCLLLGIPALFLARRLYFLSVTTVNVRIAVYKGHYSWLQAEKDGVQELTRLIARFPNAQKFTLTWEWNRPNYHQTEGLKWDKHEQIYEGICWGEPCPLPYIWHGISRQDVQQAASKHQTMTDIITKKHLK